MSQPVNPNGNPNENILNFELNETIPNIEGSNKQNVQQIPNRNRTKLKDYITALKLRTSKYTLLPNTKRPGSSYKKIIYYISKLNEELEKFKQYKNLNTFNSSEAENNYISKITDLKQTIIDSIKYWTIINKLYRDNYEKFDVNKFEEFFRNLSQKYKENAVSFKKELYGNDTTQYPGYLKLYEQTKIDFEKKIKELKIIYEENMNINITKIVELYIRQVKGFEYYVQDFYKTISDILHKLSDLTRSIASNEEMQQLNLQLSNKISIIFNNNKKPSKNVSLKNLFNKITNGHQNKLKQQKKFINRFSNVLKSENQKITFQYLLKFVNNNVENKELSQKDIQEFNEIPINGYFSTILTFYNTKLAARITNINDLLNEYKALCTDLKNKIRIATESKTATTNLQKINRIKEKVNEIMTQYTQLETIGTNCNNLGQKIHKLIGQETNGNGQNPQGRRTQGNPLIIAQQAPINISTMNTNGSNDSNFITEINKAYFIFNYLFDTKTKQKIFNKEIRYFVGPKSSLFNLNGTVAVTKEIYDPYKNNIIKFINNIKQTPRQVSDNNTKPINLIGNNGYNKINKIKKLTYTERINYAFNNKEWLVEYLNNVRTVTKFTKNYLGI